MPPHGQKQKRVEDKRSAEEIAIESAKNSSYNILTPMFNAQHLRVRNPITSLDKLYDVNKPNFFEDFYELSQKGLEERLFAELNTFAKDIDPNWSNVIQSLNGYFKVKNSDAANEHQ